MTGFNPGATGGYASSDLASQFGGIVKNSAASSGGDIGSFLGSAVGGGLSLFPGGALFAPLASGAVGALAGLFGGHKTDEAAQTRDINTIAEYWKVTGTESAAVIADHCDHSPDHFDDLARSVAASDGLRRFPELLAEYNSRHPSTKIALGSVRAAAQQQAQQQQQMISTALSTPNFGSSATSCWPVALVANFPGSRHAGPICR